MQDQVPGSMPPAWLFQSQPRARCPDDRAELWPWAGDGESELAASADVVVRKSWGIRTGQSRRHASRTGCAPRRSHHGSAAPAISLRRFSANTEAWPGSVLSARRQRTIARSIFSCDFSFRGSLSALLAQRDFPRADVPMRAAALAIGDVRQVRGAGGVIAVVRGFLARVPFRSDRMKYSWCDGFASTSISRRLWTRGSGLRHRVEVLLAHRFGPAAGRIVLDFGESRAPDTASAFRVRSQSDLAEPMIRRSPVRMGVAEVHVHLRQEAFAGTRKPSSSDRARVRPSSQR